MKLGRWMDGWTDVVAVLGIVNSKQKTKFNIDTIFIAVKNSQNHIPIPLPPLCRSSNHSPSTPSKTKITRTIITNKTKFRRITRHRFAIKKKLTNRVLFGAEYHVK